MSNYYAPCFSRIDFVVIPAYVELPWLEVVGFGLLSFGGSFRKKFLGFSPFAFSRIFLP